MYLTWYSEMSWRLKNRRKKSRPCESGCNWFATNEVALMNSSDCFHRMSAIIFCVKWQGHGNQLNNFDKFNSSFCRIFVLSAMSIANLANNLNRVVGLMGSWHRVFVCGLFFLYICFYFVCKLITNHLFPVTSLVSSQKTLNSLIQFRWFYVTLHFKWVI